MSRILHIDSSARGEGSHSRQISAELVQALTAAHPNTTVTYRDLRAANLPFVTENWFYGAYTPPADRTDAQNDALKLSDTLIDELLAADVLVFGIPMYNFSVPAVFKAYIDQIARVGRTFTSSYEGLVKGKKAFVVTARGGGGYGPGEPRETVNFEDPYLKSALGFIGITDVTFLHINNTARGEEVQASLNQVRTQIKEAASVS